MNYKIVIDPGHGGTDPGATANNIIEKDLTLKISKYMKDKLEGLGIPVSITRTNDETLSPNERVKRFIHYFKMDEIELACFQRRMVDSQPKTIITYGLQGPNSVTYSHTYIVEQIEDEIKRSLERNKKIESVGYQKQKLK